MVLGLSLATFTLVHVIITLIAIVSGLIVVYGLTASARMDGLTGVFLAFTALTDITGFLFPFHGVTPGIKLGVASSVVLIVTLLARYAFAMRGVWRPVYVIGAVLSLWFNLFVLVVQAFQKVAALHALAPTGSEPPFAIVQGLVLLAMAIVAILGLRRFHPAIPAPLAAPAA